MSTKDQLDYQTSPEWNASLQGDYLWSNVNFGEAVTDVMTPLTWSVIQFTLEDWVFIPGCPTVAQIGGYPYLNISIFATMFHLTGRGREELLARLESTLYMPLPDDVQIPLVPLTIRQRIASLLSAMKVQIKQRQGVRALPAYLESNQAFFNKSRTGIDRQEDKTGLFDLWHTSLRPHVKEGVWCVLGTASHASDFTMELRRDLEDLIGLESAQRLIANISDPNHLLASLGPMVGLDKIARGEWSRDQYMAEYGHRGPHEFELSIPRPAEDPYWLDRELKHWVRDPQDLTSRISGQRTTFLAAWNRLKEDHPRKVKAFKRRIKESAHLGRQREEARSAYVRDRWLVRLYAVKAAELTGIGDDIFFLTMDEILETLTGTNTPNDTIQARKKAYLDFKTLPSYPSIIRGTFDPFGWAADPGRRVDIYSPGKIDLEEEGPTIKGSPGSAGIAAGRVRRLTKPEDGHQLKQGEILLALQTDIAWTVLFPRASAVITDIGAPLSHAAIVARELGIPAVVGCGNAMTRLKTGDLVRVDGSRGTVTKTN